VVAVAGIFAWPYVKMEFASNAYYSQEDELEYEYYTPEILKKIPRISENYTFQYISNHDAQSAFHGIQFEGVTDMSKVRDYLKSEGYEPQPICDTSAECWKTSKSKDILSIYSTSSPDKVVVEISEN